MNFRLSVTRSASTKPIYDCLVILAATVAYKFSVLSNVFRMPFVAFPVLGDRYRDSYRFILVSQLSSVSINVAQNSVQTYTSNYKDTCFLRYVHIRRNLWRTCSSRLKGQTTRERVKSSKGSWLFFCCVGTCSLIHEETIIKKERFDINGSWLGNLIQVRSMFAISSIFFYKYIARNCHFSFNCS